MARPGVRVGVGSVLEENSSCDTVVPANRLARTWQWRDRAAFDGPRGGRLCPAMTIPARVHFCWIGPALPWAYVFAILSAAARGEMDEVILHHTDELAGGPGLAA